MGYDIYKVKDKELYGAEIPFELADLIEIKEKGIKVIISLTEEIDRIKDIDYLKENFEHHRIFIEDYHTPEKKQVEEFLNIIERSRKEKKPVLVHCIAGCGRTGLMLAIAEKFIYGIKDGNTAIKKIREIRPCAIENSDQESFVINFEM
ncbi:MAG: dual specificity protein phosphatase family protein [Candidatus Heimdallarchaeota archaeon]